MPKIGKVFCSHRIHIGMEQYFNLGSFLSWDSVSAILEDQRSNFLYLIHESCELVRLADIQKYKDLNLCQQIKIVYSFMD